jgi:predicted acylesterase/phospholipase RssA
MEQTKPLKLALTFSGGGYRASAFSLGVLSYLDRLKIDERSLLEQSVILSTVSGGTIAGMRYTLGVARGEKFESIYQSLYSFMNDTDVIALALSKLCDNSKWTGRTRSLINSFADVYSEKLFSDARFEILMDNVNVHFKHFSFNATEFGTGTQFRFQWSERILNPKPGAPVRGLIGNNNFPIPEAAAAESRLGDILASSSCFPGGFEPINFPSDFIHKPSPNLETLTHPLYPIGVMDGGIVDNQGIEPVILAEKRMGMNAGRSEPSDENEIDLLIVSDVASPFVDSFKASTNIPKKFWSNWTLSRIFRVSNVLLLLSIAGAVYAVYREILPLAIVSAIVFTLSALVSFVGSFLKKIPTTFDLPQSFRKPLGGLLKLSLGTIATLLKNRMTSFLALNLSIFLKHMRAMNYDTLYDIRKWKNRLVMNAVYELKVDSPNLAKKIANNELPPDLVPSEALQEVASIAASMGTTLWFTEDELKKKNMLNVLIATGQFTCCWNLLELKHKLEKSGENKKVLDVLRKLEVQMMTDWKKFNVEPMGLV